MGQVLHILTEDAAGHHAAADAAFQALRAAQAAHPRLQAERAAAVVSEQEAESDDGDDYTSLQTLGFASVLVCFRVDEPDAVTVTGAMVGGEFVDEQFFAQRVVSGWAEAIRLEIAQDKLFSSWVE